MKGMTRLIRIAQDQASGGKGGVLSFVEALRVRLVGLSLRGLLRWISIA